MDEIADRDPNVLEALNALVNHRGYPVLVEEVTAAREKFFQNFARGLATSRNPVDQREVDEKRGFWMGAVWAVTRFPKLASKDWEKFVEEALKESETA